MSHFGSSGQLGGPSNRHSWFTKIIDDAADRVKQTTDNVADATKDAATRTRQALKDAGTTVKKEGK
jgi:hypothetical protein